MDYYRIPLPNCLDNMAQSCPFQDEQVLTNVNAKLAKCANDIKSWDVQDARAPAL